MFENPTEAELDRMVQGYRDKLNGLDPQHGDEPYLHGFRNADNDRRGISEGWQFDQLDKIRKEKS